LLEAGREVCAGAWLIEHKAMCSLGVVAFLTIIPLGKVSGQTFLIEALTQEN
jgi:hypothetical protein